MIICFASFLGTIGPLSTWTGVGYQRVSVSMMNITGALPGSLHNSLTPFIDHEKYTYSHPTRTMLALLGGRASVRLPWCGTYSWGRYVYGYLLQRVRRRLGRNSTLSLTASPSPTQTPQTTGSPTTTGTKLSASASASGSAVAEEKTAEKDQSPSWIPARLFDFADDDQDDPEGSGRSGTCSAATCAPSCAAQSASAGDGACREKKRTKFLRALNATAQYLWRAVQLAFRLPLAIGAPLRAQLD